MRSWNEAAMLKEKPAGRKPAGFRNPHAREAQAGFLFSGLSGVRHSPRHFFIVSPLLDGHFLSLGRPLVRAGFAGCSSAGGSPLSHRSRVCVRLVTPWVGSKQSARS
jgi:hypothetical protein